MQQNIVLKKVRINVQVPAELKKKLEKASIIEGKKLSVLIRESIEQKVEQIEENVFKEKMKHAYMDLAKENIEISKDFEYSDAENL